MLDKEEMHSKINLASYQQKLLNLIFDNISDDHFDTDLSLGDFDTSKLKDFWMYTTGFLCVQNYETKDNLFTSQEAQDILNGSFIFQALERKNAANFAEGLGFKFPKDFPKHTDLFSVQDGKYFLSKNEKTKLYEYRLTTNPIRIIEDDKEINLDQFDPAVILKHIRNVIVHEPPYLIEDENLLIFRDGSFYIEISNMWLRGFSELFSNKYQKINPEELRSVLIENADWPITNDADLDKVLSNVKDFFGNEIKSKYFRVNNFTKLRTKYVKDFYKKSKDEQISLLIDYLTKNPNMLTGPSETINPIIIYNLQQLISTEISRRNQDSIINYIPDDIFDLLPVFVKITTGKTLTRENLFEQLEILAKELDEHNYITEIFSCDSATATKLNNCIKSYVKTFVDAKNLRPGPHANAIKNKIKTAQRYDELIYEKLKQQLIAELKTESAHMNLYDAEGLKNLPVEVAFNIVSLMGYNSLITSGFYEDILAGTNFDFLSPEKNKILSTIKFDGISCSIARNHNTNYTNSQKAFILNAIRTALCHGTVSYVLPSAKLGENKSFNDVSICFTIYGKNDTQYTISGKLIDFYKLFNQSPFMKNRDGLYNEIEKVMLTQTPTKTSTAAEDFADMIQEDNDDPTDAESSNNNPFDK